MPVPQACPKCQIVADFDEARGHLGNANNDSAIGGLTPQAIT
jgi:hypothetical protein